MFFESDGKLFPLSSIKSLATNEHNTTTVVLENGDELESDDFYPRHRIVAGIPLKRNFKDSQ